MAHWQLRPVALAGAPVVSTQVAPGPQGAVTQASMSAAHTDVRGVRCTGYCVIANVFNTCLKKTTRLPSRWRGSRFKVVPYNGFGQLCTSTGLEYFLPHLVVAKATHLGSHLSHCTPGKHLCTCTHDQLRHPGSLGPQACPRKKQRAPCMGSSHMRPHLRAKVGADSMILWETWRQEEAENWAGLRPSQIHLAHCQQLVCLKETQATCHANQDQNHQ